MQFGSRPAYAVPNAGAEKKEPVLYTGKNCLSQMAKRRALATGRVAGSHGIGSNAESTGHDGKSTIWRAMFASRQPGHEPNVYLFRQPA